MQVVVYVLSFIAKVLGFTFGVSKSIAKASIKEARTTGPKVMRAMKEGSKAGQQLDVRAKLNELKKKAVEALDEESEESSALHREESPPTPE